MQVVTSFSYIISSYILFLHIAVNCRYIRSQFSQTFVGWLSPIPLSTDLSQGKINQSLGREGGFLSWRNCISFFSECGFLFKKYISHIYFTMHFSESFVLVISHREVHYLHLLWFDMATTQVFWSILNICSGFNVQNKYLS